jgi:hypothetical protein
MAAVMKATSSARRKVAAASDVKIISYYLNNLKKLTQKDFIINESLTSTKRNNVTDIVFNIGMCRRKII